MVQALTTIFFSAAAVSAFSIIVLMLADNLADVRRALGLFPTDAVGMPPLPATRTRRVRVLTRGNPVTPSALPQRAAA
jgi:hypothetical protein